MSAQMNELAKTTLDTLAEEINAEHAATEDAFSESLQHARRAGELLIEAKSEVPHGEWLRWLEANCDFKPRTAQVYMRIKREWKQLSNTQSLAHLGIENATKLLAAPIPKTRLEQLEARIEKAISDERSARRALAEVRDDELWQEMGYASWGNYIANHGLTAKQADDFIRVGRVWDVLESASQCAKLCSNA